MKVLSGLTLAATLLIPSFANAHTPLFSCYDMGDGTIECEGGFSNGSSASGVKVFIKDASGAEIKNAALDENSYIIISKPDGAYTVTMDAGEGHAVIVKSEDITE